MPDNHPAKPDERPTALVEWSGCPRPIPRYLTKLPWAESDDEIIDAITERILASETPDGVLELAETTSMEALIGRRVQVNGFVMRAGDLDDGIGCYALVAFDDLDRGETGFTTTGAKGQLAQLARMWQLGAFPFSAVVTEVESKKKGHTNPRYFTQMEKAF